MKLEYRRVVPGPPAEVFRQGWDPQAQKSRDPRILKYEVVGGGEPKAGGRLSIALAHRGQVLTTEKEVLALDDAGPIFGAETVEVVRGMRFHCRSRYAPHAEGTEVELRYDVSAVSLFGYVALLFFFLHSKHYFGREVRGWLDRLADGVAQGALRSPVSAQARAGGAARCPYCHTRAEPADSVACTGCFARHHTGCWDEHGECSACGERTRFVGIEETEGRARQRRTDEKT